MLRELDHENVIGGGLKCGLGVTMSTGPAIRQTTIDGNASTSFSAGHDTINPVSGISASISFRLYF